MEEAKRILAKARVEKLPIVDENFNLKGLITIKDIEKQIKYPNSAKDDHGRLLCGAAIGITANVLERTEALVNAKVDVVVLDSAHGHSANVLNCVKMIKEKYPDLQVIAGNVATGEATRALIEAGVDAGVKMWLLKEIRKVAEKEVRSCLALREVRRKNNYSMCHDYDCGHKMKVHPSSNGWTKYIVKNFLL